MPFPYNKPVCPHRLPPLLCLQCSRTRCPHGMSDDCLLCGAAGFRQLFPGLSQTRAVAAPAPKADGPFTVQRGQMTFDAEGAEGGKYHSRQAHWPGGASGVTIGRGYDMKERSTNSVIADLTAAGVPAGEAKTLAGGAGQSGNDASSFIQKTAVAAIEISKEAQKKLFVTVYDEKLERVRAICTKKDTVEVYGSVDVDTLDPTLLDVVVDLIFRGDYDGESRKVIQKHIVKNDLQGLYDALTNCKPYKDTDLVVQTDIGKIPRMRFIQRKDYMKAALDAQKAGKAAKA